MYCIYAVALPSSDLFNLNLVLMNDLNTKLISYR